jgi:hypothetical protein
MFDVASVLYFMSMQFDRESTMAQSQLYYIQQITGKKSTAPSRDEVQKTFNDNGIQFGANNHVLGIAAGLGKSAKEQGHHDAARFFFSILYDLTGDDDVKSWIDSLPASGTQV